MKNKLETKTAGEILTTVFPPMEYLVDGLLPQGLFILAGTQKVGKSWLALDLCVSIATERKVLGRSTVRRDALYLCLEDNFRRIQKRLFAIDAPETEDMYCAITSGTIENGLLEQIEDFYKEHIDLGLVVIDTLQKVREGVESTYATDYKEMSALKALADKLDITIIVIHHTRKMPDSDPFNQITGSTGLSGCADGSFVLAETYRGSGVGTLTCVGRDVGFLEIKVHFDQAQMRWIAEEDLSVSGSKNNLFLSAVYVFIREKLHFVGTPTELSDELKAITDETFYPNRIKRDLVENGYTLMLYGIVFAYERRHSGRYIKLDYYPERDSSVGRNDSGFTVAQLPVNVSQSS